MLLCAIITTTLLPPPLLESAMHPIDFHTACVTTESKLKQGSLALWPHRRCLPRLCLLRQRLLLLLSSFEILYSYQLHLRMIVLLHIVHRVRNSLLVIANTSSEPDHLLAFLRVRSRSSSASCVVSSSSKILSHIVVSIRSAASCFSLSKTATLSKS